MTPVHWVRSAPRRKGAALSSDLARAAARTGSDQDRPAGDEARPDQTSPAGDGTTPLDSEAAADSAPAAAAPSGAVPTGTVPADPAPTGAAPSDAAPTGAAPSDAGPTGAVPADPAPIGPAPPSAVPAGPLPADVEAEVSEEAEFEADPNPTQPLPGLPLLLDDEPDAIDTAAMPDIADTTYRRRVRARLARRLTAGGQRPSGIQAVLEPLVATHRAAHPKADLKILQRAYDIAEEHHRGQLRKSGDPFITHPLAVATILAELGMDTTTLVAALLHDTVEDTGYSIEDVKRDFDAEVAHLVDGVTKLDKVKYGDAAEAETIRKMIVAMARDPRVLVIKLADRLHNMRTLRFLRPDKQERIARQTLEVLAPLAHRLGMNTVKWELEDLAFATLYPKRYDEIVRLVAERAPSRDTYLARVVERVSADLRAARVKATVTGRPKHYYSIYQKMIVRGRDFTDIYDLVGIRILVDSVRDCYATLGVVHATWQPVPGRFKDYIAMPKFNMYQSLHTTVIGPEGKPVELQIRTLAMHRTAEYGIAAHWKYKETKEVATTPTTQGGEDLLWLRQLLDWQRETQEPGEFLESLRFDLGSREVFVFTPKGDVIALPSGSTPVDFAYAVHTEVGHRCIGARVNGRLVALESPLENGDTVEVFTSKSEQAGPSRDWLSFVASPRREDEDPAVVRQGAARGRDRVRQGRDQPGDAQGRPPAAAAARRRRADHARPRPALPGRHRAVRGRRRGTRLGHLGGTEGGRLARRVRGGGRGHRRDRGAGPDRAAPAGRGPRRRGQGRHGRLGQAGQVLHAGARRRRSSASSPAAAACPCTARPAPTRPRCWPSRSGSSRSSGRRPPTRCSSSRSRSRRSTGTGCSPTSPGCSPTSGSASCPRR